MNVLIEKSRNELVADSKRGQKERDGKTRYEKRNNSKIATNIKQYNRIDMNKLFKEDILTINIEVTGETDNYIVSISFSGFLDQLYSELKKRALDIDLKLILKALINTFNKEQIYIKCTCPDHKYRFHYWATLDKYNLGEPELRPADETNPNNSLGSACKHVLLVLSNRNWLIKVAGVINNYIKYMEIKRPSQYDKIIYPAIYRKKKPVQMSFLDNEDELEVNDEIINKQGSRMKRPERVNPAQEETVDEEGQDGEQ